MLCRTATFVVNRGAKNQGEQAVTQHLRIPSSHLPHKIGRLGLKPSWFCVHVVSDPRKIGSKLPHHRNKRLPTPHGPRYRPGASILENHLGKS